MSLHTDEIKNGTRFSFGKNWQSYLSEINIKKISESTDSLKTMLNVNSLSGMRFLDIGSGSGLFSLAAKQLGASVVSFDFDPDSVKCTQYLKEKYLPEDQEWTITEGSILDEAFIKNLGDFDIVYSWGVLHHTGDMHAAFHNATQLVKSGGKLFIAIYNDQGIISQYWKFIKKLYNKNKLSRVVITAVHIPYLFGIAYILHVTGILKKERGMLIWYDMIDWLGGYPFEYAKPNQIIDYFNTKGFSLEKIKTRGMKMGCNEFVFKNKI